MQGASPLASPGLNPRGTGSPCRCGKLNGGGLPRRCRLGERQRYPAGGLPRRCRRGGRQRYPAGGVPALSPAYPATVVPAGGVPALSPVNPAFSLLFRPYPPSPLPNGKGEIFCFLMQGAAPLASPGLNPHGTGSPCRCGKLNGGACPGVAGAAGVSGTRRGACLLCRLPALPLTCFLAPIPPAPFPAGRG